MTEREKFMAAVRGIPAIVVANTASHFSSSTSYTGCNKSEIGSSWANDRFTCTLAQFADEARRRFVVWSDRRELEKAEARACSSAWRAWGWRPGATERKARRAAMTRVLVVDISPTNQDTADGVIEAIEMLRTVEDVRGYTAAQGSELAELLEAFDRINNELEGDACE